MCTERRALVKYFSNSFAEAMRDPLAASKHRLNLLHERDRRAGLVSEYHFIVCGRDRQIETDQTIDDRHSEAEARLGH